MDRQIYNGMAGTMQISCRWQWTVILAMMAGISQAETPATPVWNVKAYGAAGDGRTRDTAALQAALDACAAAGGGMVLVPAGDYVSGTLVLRDRTTLHLDAGARILGSQNIADYPEMRPAWRSYTDRYHQRALFHAEKIKEFTLEGPGVVDGRGGAFSWKDPRPMLFRFIECGNIVLRGVTLRDGGYWTVHFLACANVLAEGVTIRSRCNRNNDGLDIDACEDVRVNNCDIDSIDDAIVLKSTSNRVCRRVAVTNCRLSSSANALKAGTESNGGFQQVAISNCMIYDTVRAGLALEMMDGGLLDGVSVNNLVMRNVTVPIFIRLGNRARPFQEGGPKPGVGALRAVNISDVTATGAGVTGCSITGLSGHPVEGIRLDNIRITSAGGGRPSDAFREIPELPDTYPEGTMFGTLPAFGFYVRHARDVSLDGLVLRTEKSDRRPALVADDVDGLAVDRLDAPTHGLQPALILLRDTRNACIGGCVAPPGAPVFLRVDGKQSAGIALMGNDLHHAAIPWKFGRSADHCVVRTADR